MRILIALTYYRPHYSGLTIYTERMAQALARRGHQVTVLTSRFNSQLPHFEQVNGVNIIRLGVLMRISKGVIMPSMPYAATRLIIQSDIVSLHVPQLDAAPITMMAKLMGKPVLVTYHCDLHLPHGPIHWIANQVSHLANHISVRMADVIVTNTLDYARHSHFLQRYLDKVKVIHPPVELPNPSEDDIRTFRQKFNIQGSRPLIGMAARLASEKGVEYLIRAFPHVLDKFPTARVLFVGQYQNVLGEEEYARQLTPLLEGLGDHWSFLGILSPLELAAFFRECSVTVLPSINSTESFGLVQIESMSAGTPVIATDLPGVRHPVLTTGMGCIVPPCDSEALGKAIVSVLTNPEQYWQDPENIRQAYSSDHLAEQYEQLFRDLAAG